MILNKANLGLPVHQQTGECNDQPNMQTFGMHKWHGRAANRNRKQMLYSTCKAWALPNFLLLLWTIV